MCIRDSAAGIHSPCGRAQQRHCTGGSEQQKMCIRDSLNTAPYYAIKVTAGVHHTMGGLKINTNTEVLKLSLIHLWWRPSAAPA